MRAFTLVVLGLNVAWFGLGFTFFWPQARRAVRLLVPHGAREDVAAHALVASLPFLGGLNLGFAALSATVLVPSLLGSGLAAPWQIYAASAVAHATQFACNVPHARRGGRAGGAPWDVLRGTMLFIFTMDAACAVLNAIAAAIAAA